MIKIHREGRFILFLTLLILTGLLILSSLYFPLWLHYLLTAGALALIVLMLRFFRVPHRMPFRDEKTLTAPADGKVVVVEKVKEDEFLHNAAIQISIFMSIHDVHINYFPVDGMLSYKKYHPGKYLVARHPKSSQLNERMSLGLVTPYGSVLVRQIAGYVARRIRNYAKEGAPARQGEEMGFIKFGSRLDLFLPEDAKILVKAGERVIGSQTPLARFK